jgi:hypothetical protein
MRRHLRNLLASLALAALITAPAGAATTTDQLDVKPAPPMLDALIMRPLGLVALGVGAVLWIPAAGITAITRPSEVGTATHYLLRVPADYVFSDPLGSH